MPDSELTILVRTLSETYGIDNVNKALSNLRGETGHASAKTDELKESTEEAHHSFLHVESSSRAFHGILHKLTEESPLLGIALRLALNPVTGVLFAIGTAFTLVKKNMEELEKKSEELAGNITAHYLAIVHASNQAAAEAESANRKFEQSMHDLEAAQDSAEAKATKVTEAIKAQGEALKALAEIKGEGKEASAAIDLNTELRLAIAKTFQAQEAEAKAPGLHQANLEAKAGDRSKDYETSISRGQLESQRMEKEIDNLEKEKQKYFAMQESHPLIAAKMADPTVKLLDAQKELAEQNKRNAENQNLLAQEKAKVAAAEKAELDNKKDLESSKADARRMEETYRQHAAVSTLKEHPEDAAILAKGAEALQALTEHGGKLAAITGEQVKNIRALTGFLTQHDANNATMVKLIEDSAGNTEKLAARLVALEARNKSSVNP